MKKISLMILIALLTFGLCACTNGADPIDTDNAGTPDIPNNGTAAELPEPFANHDGDQAYFYPTSEDYLVVMYDGADTDISSANGVITYELISFSDGEVSDTMHKWVFADDATAKAYVEGKGGFVAYNNIVYEIAGNAAFMDPSKESVVNWAKGKGGEIYLSEPSGLEDE